ncbi:MAG: cob(I)yrinic acid a,c-diamide adenosyltransferase [Xanthobacteraceae bacterium]|nr:cob(I)yrinic acid a,c-diamide adenosyltransferase [Xanthobacteraceae bacterium]
MVKLNRIYTRTGDDGTTGLVNGERRAKHDLRIATFGTVDEVNACIGAARVATKADDILDAMLGRIQNDLFDLGADLATPESDIPPAYEPLRILSSQVDRLEREIDQLNLDMAPLNSFVLPGGSEAAARLHIARTVCRRAERLAVELSEKTDERISPAVVKYLNRLSDFLFVAARHANDKGASDVLWVPGRNR